MTWSNISLIDFSCRASGLKTLKFSKSVYMESKTWLRTVAICTSARFRRSCSTARAAGAAVANEASRLVVPLGKQKIDPVLERAGDSIVVLGRDENVGIETFDLSGPYSGMRLTVL